MTQNYPQQEKQLAQQARETLVANAEAERDVAELRAKASEKEKYTAQERLGFLQQAGEVAHVTDCYEQNRNISEAYYDTESRIVTQRTKLERLQELLKQADTMEDIITLESAISETELAIEQLTGSLRKYDNLVDFSTITVTLNEVYRLSTDEVPEQTFGDRLRNAFVRGIDRGIDNLEDFVISIARNWITLLVWAAVIAGGFTFLRRRWKKRRTFLRKPEQIPEDKGE